jgi:hypothetical protein
MTEEQISAIASLLEFDPQAKKAQAWLWNNADSDLVRHGYFEEIVRAVLRAVNIVEPKLLK